MSPTLQRIYSCLIEGSDLVPLFTNLMYSMEYIEDPSCGTMATDGKKVWYSPEWVKTLTDNELTGVLIHEFIHSANDHPFRMRGLDKDRVQKAADLSVNSIIMDYGRVQLPEGGIFPGCGEFSHIPERGESLEYYYRRLQDTDEQNNNANQGPPDEKDGADTESPEGPNKPDQDATSPDNGSKGDPNDTVDDEQEDKSSDKDSKGGNKSGGQEDDTGNTGDGDGNAGDEGGSTGTASPGDFSNTPGGIVESDESNAMQVYNALQGSKGCSDEVGKIFEKGSAMKSSGLNYADVLREFLTVCTRTGYSYRRINKKYACLYDDVIFPGKKSVNNANILYAVDCSGSMSSELCNIGMNAIKEMVEAYPSLKLTLVQFSDDITYEHEFFAGEDIPEEWFLRGRGGTKLGWLSEYLLGKQFKCVVIYTDGEVRTPPDPGIPVCWLLTGKIRDTGGLYVVNGPGFGKVVEIGGI